MTHARVRPPARPEREGKHLWALSGYARCLVWVGLIPVAYFSGWLGSVVFVAACSLYANAAGDFSSARSDADAQLDRIEDKLDYLLEAGGE
jgi:hypothetical protein